METPERAAQRIFGERAAFYTRSASHTDPQVLAKLVQLCRAELAWYALDVATGTGHTAFAVAPHVARVIGCDLTPAMLREAIGLQDEGAPANVELTVADVHCLPFGNGAFDLVTARRAPHHFSDIRAALREIARAVKPGGRVVIDDRSVPEDDFVDETMNALDLYHDRSHIRQYRPSTWVSLLEEARLISLFGSTISSITFVAYPADAYKTAYLRLLICFMLPVGVFIASRWFVPFFRRGKITSAFQYLEGRFGPTTRVYAASVFIVAQCIRLSLIDRFPTIETPVRPELFP